MSKSTKKNIEAVYLLSPMQQGMLFHTIYAPDSSIYFEQLHFKLKGQLKIEFFKQALQRVIERHPVLRTSFVWKKTGKMMQVVHKEIPLPLEMLDWRQHSSEEQQSQFAELLNKDRKRGFKLNKAPLLRTTLIQLDEETWQVIWSNHHIILDGWSNPILLKEIFTLYEGLMSGHDIPLPNARPYRDYVAWLQKQDKNKAETYWRELLGDFSTPTNLTIAKSVKKQDKVQADYISHHIELNSDTSKKLLALGRKNNLTVSTFVQGAWSYLLHRYTAEDDLVIGVTVSGRPPAMEGVESMVGLFINTLPLRIKIDQNMPAIEWLKTIQHQSIKMREFEYSSLAEVQRLSNLESNTPLFNSIVVFENYPVDRSLQEQKGSLQIQDFGSYEQTNFPMILLAASRGDSITLELKYDPNKYDKSTVKNILQHISKLFEIIVQNPQQKLQKLHIMSDKELRKLLEGWKGKFSAIQPEDDIIHTLENHARNNPQSIALMFKDKTYTYQELNRLINVLSNFLIQSGLKREELVGLYLDPSPKLVIGLLAVLKAGGAYVPVDSTYPQERIKYVLKDANVRFILSENNLSDRLADFATEIINLDDILSSVNTVSDKNPGLSIDDQQLAYMIYTSGSTGQPKGTMCTHQGLKNYLSWVKKTYPVQKGRGSVLHSSIAFDATITSIFSPIIAGKTIFLTDNKNNLESLANALLKYKDFSIIKITPAHLDLLTNQISADKAPEITNAFIVGGENLTDDQIEFWRKNASDTLLYNEYGPTEAVVGCVVYEAHEWDGTGSVPIGQAINNIRIYILDNHLRPVPQGIVGELYIAGDCLARGYHNRPDLTAERFLPDPFSGEIGTRMYKTGDLVQQQTDGSLVFIDRIDNQIKIRGYRIELGEIESRMSQHQAISDAVVTVWTDSNNSKQIIGYYTKSNNQDIQHNELKTFLASSLPDYMIPNHFVALEEIPLTANGKVNRKKLPNPVLSRELSSSEYVEPRSESERLLAEIWRALLNISKIGVNDSFFDLGGHSLLATQLASRIRDAFGVELSLQELFEQPTIAHIAIKIETLRQSDQGLAVPPLTPAERPKSIPASFSQQRLWFLDQLAGGSSFYNIPAALRLRGELDVAVLQKSINTLIERHEALRTHFAEREGEPEQIIDPPFTIDLQPTDLTSLPENEKQEKAYQLASAEALEPFNLNKGPLMRVRLIRLQNDEHVIIFTLHHTVTDGWSMGVLVREVITLYQAYQDDQPNPLPDLNVQYADYAIWQRQVLQGETLQQELDFWKNEIGVNPPVLDLPTDHPRPAMQTFNGNTIDYKLPADLQNEIHRFNQKQGVTLFMTMMGAFQALMHRYSGQDVLQVGSPIANRTQSETEAIIGFFVNTLIFQADFSDDPDFRTFLKQVRERTLGIYAHQHLPFEQLVEVLQPERDMSHAPLFQVAFILQNAPMDKMEISGLTAEPFHHENKTAKYDLTVYSMEYEDGIGLSFEYNTDLFKEQTIRRMQKHFENMLRAVITEPKQKISAVNFLSTEEQQTMFADWNNTTRDYPSQHTVHQLFEEWAEKQPGQTALVFAGETLTYAELNTRANQLAHYLRKKGVGPDDIVGISLPRSMDVPVAVLAILKAGGAFLPIDPTYPQERIAYMIEDSGIEMLLTHQSVAGQFDREGLHVLALDAEQEKLEQEAADDLPGNTMPSNLAYVIYTSGSTGRPKGTMLQHQGLCNLSQAQQKAFSIQPQSRILQFAPMSFDASVWETVMGLLNGAALVLSDQESLTSGQGLLNVLKSNDVTTVTLPPSVLAVMPEDELPELKTIVTAGEKCTTDLVRRWGQNRQFVNAYGPTETTVCASMYDTGGDTSMEPPIGRAVDNFQLYVLDKNWQAVPIGVPGELCVGGVGLARGYLNRPHLTADKFIPDPFSGRKGSRLYRTGDLVRYLPDGNLEFIGRIDFQVKLRGFRIELGEIEAVLTNHDNIRDAAVLVREDTPGDQRLVAYYVSEDGTDISGAELRSYLKQQLPDYMVPSIFVVLETMPLTPSGKVDRKSLPKPDQTRRDLESEYVAPRNENEEKLAAMVGELLNLEKVGVYDNFFELGGHSLLATKFMSRIREQFNIELPLRILFEKPTVAQLAEALISDQITKSDESDKIERMDRGSESLEDLLDDLDQLSDEEARALLEKAAGKDEDKE